MNANTTKTWISRDMLLLASFCWSNLHLLLATHNYRRVRERARRHYHHAQDPPLLRQQQTGGPDQQHQGRFRWQGSPRHQESVSGTRYNALAVIQNWFWQFMHAQRRKRFPSLIYLRKIGNESMHVVILPFPPMARPCCLSGPTTTPTDLTPWRHRDTHRRRTQGKIKSYSKWK